MKFTHNMKNFEYLKSSLENGLMYTKHNVELKISDNDEEVLENINKYIPYASININFPLNRENEIRLISNMSSTSMEIDMLCFTETHKNMDISHQKYLFGNYGLVFTTNFIETNNGDKVIYYGNNSPATKALHNIIQLLRVKSLYYHNEGRLMSKGGVWEHILKLLCYIETRKHNNEIEWRIPQFDMFNEKINKYLKFTLSDILYILVNSDDEKKEIEILLNSKKNRDNFTGKMPEILVNRKTIP